MIHSEYQQIQTEFGQRHPLFIERLEELQRLIFFFREALEEREITDSALEIYTLFRQGLESFNSILILASRGFSRNALQLLRSMFEDCVTMRYLAKVQSNPVNPTPAKPYPDSLDKFRDFFFVNLVKQFRFGREHFPEIITESDLEAVKAKYDNIVKQFTITDCKRCKTKKVEHKWGLDLISMAKALNLELLLFECYYLPLTLCHPSANGINLRWDTSDGRIEYRFESVRAEAIAIRNAHLLLLLTLETTARHFSVNDTDGIWQRNMTNWDEVWKKVRNHNEYF